MDLGPVARLLAGTHPGVRLCPGPPRRRIPRCRELPPRGGRSRHRRTRRAGGRRPRTNADAQAVALSCLDGRPIVAAAGPGIYVWEISEDEDGDPIYDPLIGHEDQVLAMDVITVAGRPVAVTGSKDRTVRIWDLAEGTPIGGPLRGHQGAVESVVTAVLDGCEVALTAGRDGVVCAWDLSSLPDL
ncbi:WD40 repeat domain-containing protein [Nonomuraea purpurea]|uniref:WD40 repeat domain-containing protein n=1 Tax=Nonomuraea purpurea TaxID=1849276 RepID=A0ABV8G447_9ACTN